MLFVTFAVGWMMNSDEEGRLLELESRVRSSLMLRSHHPDRAAKARIAQRLGLPQPRRRRARLVLSLLAALLVLVMTSLIWIGSLVGSRPSPNDSVAPTHIESPRL